MRAPVRARRGPGRAPRRGRGSRASATSQAPSRQPRPRSTRLARFGEERARCRAVAGGAPCVGERRQEARLVPERRAPRARQRSAVSRARVAAATSPAASSAAPRNARRLDPRERAAALLRQLDRAAAVCERAGEIAAAGAAPRRGIRASRTARECCRPPPRRGALPGRSARPPPSPRYALASAHQIWQKAGAVERPSASRSPATRASSAQGSPGGGPCGIEAADRELRVRQHRAHLEREHRVVGSVGAAPPRAPRMRGTRATSPASPHRRP